MPWNLKSSPQGTRRCEERYARALERISEANFSAECSTLRSVIVALSGFSKSNPYGAE